MSKYPKSYKKSNYAMRKITSIILIVLGFLAALPFIIDTFILNHQYHYITFWPMMFLLGLVVGGPMFLGGIIAFFTKTSNGSNSTAEIDLGRIRYTVETDSRGKK